MSVNHIRYQLIIKIWIVAFNYINWNEDDCHLHFNTEEECIDSLLCEGNIL